MWRCYYLIRSGGTVLLQAYDAGEALVPFQNGVTHLTDWLPASALKLPNLAELLIRTEQCKVVCVIENQVGQYICTYLQRNSPMKARGKRA